MASDRRSLNRDIASIAVPAFATLLTQPAYLLADTAIVGHLGTDPLAALGIANTMITLAYAVFVFLTFNTAARVARDIGADRPSDAAHESIQAVWLGIVLGVVAGAAVYATAPTVIAWLTDSARVRELAVTYVRISAAGFGFLMITMAASGALRGYRDTKTPLVAAAITAVGNLVFEWWLIYGRGYGIGASAFSTVVAQGVGATILVVALSRRVRHHSATFRPSRRSMASQLRTGGDLVVRTVLLRGLFAGAVWFVGQAGVVAVAAYQVALGLWMALSYTLDALEASAHVLVGEAVGAQDDHRRRVIANRILAWAVGIGAALGLVVMAAHRILPRAFSNSSAVVAEAATALLLVGAMQPVCGAAFAVDGILVAEGRTADLRRFMAIAVGAFAVGCAVLWFTWGPNGQSVWLALTIFMTVRAGLGINASMRRRAP